MITSSTEATLSGSFSGASAVPTEVGFYWGTSSNSLTNKSKASAVSSTGGTFTAKLTGLTEGQTYVYKAYVVVSGTGSHASEQKYFYASGTRYFKTGDSSPAVAGWLELPSSTVGQQYITDILRAGGKRNYTHLYDKEMYTSLWTAYPLYSNAMGSLGRPGSWSYNDQIDTKYQVNLCKSSYSGNTYSRGHLIPNGSRNGDKTMQSQTFYVTNSVPQVQTRFNDGIWNTLEQDLQAIARMVDTVYIVTGVAFNKVGETKTVETIKAKDDAKVCPIPNYFYKVALKVKRSGSTITDACAVGVWMENKSYSNSNYSQYAVSVKQIEEWIGLDFFVNLPLTLQSKAETNTDWSTFSNFR